MINSWSLFHGFNYYLYSIMTTNPVFWRSVFFSQLPNQISTTWWISSARCFYCCSNWLRCLLVLPPSFDFPIFINPPIILCTFPKQGIIESPLVSSSLSFFKCGHYILSFYFISEIFSIYVLLSSCPWPHPWSWYWTRSWQYCKNVLNCLLDSFLSPVNCTQPMATTDRVISF